MTSVFALCRRRRTTFLLVGACCAFIIGQLFVSLLLRLLDREDSTPSKRAADLQLLFTDYSHYHNSSANPGPIRDPDSFKFLIDEPDICHQRYADVKILYYVHSAPGNFERRHFIRRTWSSFRLYPRFKMVTLFFVGLPTNDDGDDVQQHIEEESRTNRDILQVDFNDHYYNLTYKSVTALNWIKNHCLQATYVLKTDDDAFVNIFRLTNVLFHNGQPAPGHGIHCYVYRKFLPHRDPKSKWFVTANEYPWSQYPDFCPGMAIYFPSSVIPTLLNYTSQVPFLKLDDVYLTGLLRKKSNVELVDVSSHINIYHGKKCFKGSKMELFCQVADINRRWEIWIQLMVAELSKSLPWNDNHINDTLSFLYQALVNNSSIVPP